MRRNHLYQNEVEERRKLPVSVIFSNDMRKRFPLILDQVYERRQGKKRGRERKEGLQWEEQNTWEVARGERRKGKRWERLIGDFLFFFTLSRRFTSRTTCRFPHSSFSPAIRLLTNTQWPVTDPSIACHPLLFTISSELDPALRIIITTIRRSNLLLKRLPFKRGKVTFFVSLSPPHPLSLSSCFLIVTDQSSFLGNRDTHTLFPFQFLFLPFLSVKESFPRHSHQY